MLRKVCVFLYLALIISSAIAAPPQYTLVDLNQYYAEKTKGMIRPADQFVDRMGLKFVLREQRQHYVTTELRDVNVLNSLFEIDADEFMRRENASSFTQAKLNYFSKRTFNRTRQVFEREYNHLAAWKSLNHPPIQALVEKRSYYYPEFTEESYRDLESPLFEVGFQKELDSLTHTGLTYGNRLEQLDNGVESLAKKIALVNSSQKYFFAVVMVHYCDKTSSKIVDAMIKKAKAGVDVRLIVEGVWTSLLLKKCVKRFRKGGVKVILSKGFFNPKTLFTVMHDKIWISDGKRAIVGGQNMHDFENASNGFNDHTRDKDVYVEGPAVTDLLGEYIALWSLFKRRRRDVSIKSYEAVWRHQLAREEAQGLRGQKHYAKWLNNPENRGHGVCRVLVQGDQTRRSLIADTYMKIINKTKHSIVFNTPTLRFKKNGTGKKMNSKLIYAMMDKAQYQGVKVDVISNGIDGAFGEAGHQLRSFYKKLRLMGWDVSAAILSGLEYFFARTVGTSNWKHMVALGKTPNIDTWTYFNHVHSKQMLFDRVLVSTGSYNFDSHSYKNHESTILCFDQKLASEAEDGFTLDMINSIPAL
jgi:phosphatidylserine/phosphatidylglycerophosphate/cardiolipin synthase-like enzyme